MLDEGHAGQTCDQDVLLEGAEVDEGPQLPGQVAVVGEGYLLGGVRREGHGNVTATQHQLQQIVPPGDNKKKRNTNQHLSIILSPQWTNYFLINAHL